jgi:hypothetical protein
VVLASCAGLTENGAEARHLVGRRAVVFGVCVIAGEGKAAEIDGGVTLAVGGRIGDSKREARLRQRARNGGGDIAGRDRETSARPFQFQRSLGAIF